jgi:hypothetical protein
MLLGPHGAVIAKAMPAAMRMIVATPAATAYGFRSGGIGRHWSRKALHKIG